MLHDATVQSHFIAQKWAAIKAQPGFFSAKSYACLQKSGGHQLIGERADKIRNLAEAGQ